MACLSSRECREHDPLEADDQLFALYKKSASRRHPGSQSELDIVSQRVVFWGLLPTYCQVRKKNGRRPTLPRSLPRSTIGAGGLNFSVRNGKRCIPAAIVTLSKRRQIFICKGRLPFENRTARTVKSTSSPRLISTTRLHTSLHLHLWPINLVVYQESYSLMGMGDLISRRASRLDAFSGYPFRT